MSLTPFEEGLPGCGKCQLFEGLFQLQRAASLCSAYIWCLSEIRYNCLAISVQCETDTSWQHLYCQPSHPPPPTTSGPLQVGGCIARPAGQFDFLYPILLPPSSFHRCSSLINILHSKPGLSVCFWRTQSATGLDRGHWHGNRSQAPLMSSPSGVGARSLPFFTTNTTSLNLGTVSFPVSIT